MAKRTRETFNSTPGECSSQCKTWSYMELYFCSPSYDHKVIGLLLGNKYNLGLHICKLRNHTTTYSNCFK